MKKGLFQILALLLAAHGPAPGADLIRINVEAGKPGAKINPAMWGIFFEDINLGADGGLYAELVKNRSFEFPDPMMGWAGNTENGSAEIRNENPFHSANPNYLRLKSKNTTTLIVTNEGFRGMGVRAGESYNFSAQLRGTPNDSPALVVQLVGPAGDELASAEIKPIVSNWKKYSATLVPKKTEAKARLTVGAKGTLDMDMVSLFPAKTWKDRAGGLRADMVQMLADLKPGFVRFPGGCIVEGSELSRRYQWKTTIGPIEERKLLINRWNYEFKHRPTPDYFQSFGLGFFEFFQLCEDIGADPLPILNCGMACQFNTGQLVPLDQLDPYIQDALDLVEFANGPVSSPWGAKRTAMGHPSPFNLKMLGIGNEQWGPQYVERYVRFAKVLKSKHPEIRLIASAGPAPADDRFNFLWPKLRESEAEIVDEHCYANPIWFFSSSRRYDHYDRKGPKVFMGEYAAQSVAIVSMDNKNNLECALSEAAFMTGLERNADVVQLAAYAPLFAHIDGWQWTPNLIWADNLRVYGTPSYYAQQLFSRNRGDQILPVKMDALLKPARIGGGIGVGTYQTSAEFKNIRVDGPGGSLFQCNFDQDSDHWSKEAGKWAVKEGALQQSDARAIAWARAGDPSWTDYTVTLQARKLTGREGFLIAVRNAKSNCRVQWNLGGWGNRFHGIQAMIGGQETLVTQKPGSIEAGRWHDVKLDIKGNRLACYLDGQLVQEAEVPDPQVERVYSSATLDQQVGDVILKVVNPGDEPTEVEINVTGCTSPKLTGTLTTLTSGHLHDVNSLEEPKKVAPVQATLTKLEPRFHHTLSPRSLTVWRLKAQ